MRIIIDGIVYSSTPTGGVYHYFNELIPRLAKYPGNEVRLWMPKHSAAPPASPDIKIDRVTIPSVSDKWLPQGKVRATLGKTKRWLEGRWLRAKLRGMGEAVYHTTQFTVSPWDDIPRILTVYDMISEILEGDLKLPHIAKMREVKRHAIENSDRFIAISAVTKRDLCQVYGISEDKVDVIHFGVNHEFFGGAWPESEREKVRRAYQIDGRYVLYIGGRLHHKNFPRFLEAYAMSRLQRDHLLVVAGFDWTDEEKKLIEKFGVAKRIRHVPHRAAGEILPCLYQMASAFVFPSLYEGFGLPLIEAFAAGCPVAAANAGPFPEIAGDAAMFFDPRDPADMSQAIESLINQSATYRARGLARVKQFQWDRAAELTVETYRRALRQTGAVAAA